jgi:hypothetical protein
MSVNTLTIKSSQKSRELRPTVRLMRFNYMRSMTFQSTPMFFPDPRWVLRSLLFIAHKF